MFKFYHILNLLLEVMGVWQPSTHTQSLVLQAPPDQNISARERLAKVKLQVLPAICLFVCLNKASKVSSALDKRAQRTAEKKEDENYLPSSILEVQ